MRCGKALSDRRAVAFAAAPLAITLNFLQPLVHAVLMRDRAPTEPWGPVCSASPEQGQDGQRPKAPLAANKHDCCLGLAHAAAFAPPVMVASAVAPVAMAMAPLDSLDRLTPVGIRDGPHRPRGPPSFV